MGRSPTNVSDVNPLTKWSWP